MHSAADGPPEAAAGPVRSAPPRAVATVLGALVGLLSLTGMVRLTAGAFEGTMSRFAWVMVLAAMLPWVGYVAWRAGRGRPGPGRSALILGLVVAGFAAVWLSVVGPVIALLCSLAAFAVVWVSDWPRRAPRGDDRYVRIEELQREDDVA